MTQLWKSLNKICPKFKSSLPTAKLNHQGKLVSSPQQLKQLLITEYKDRLRTRPIRPDLVNLRERKMKIFDLCMKFSKLNKIQKFNINNLECALSDLKTNKSRDPQGYINEIFKKNVIGSNLKESFLIMFNRLKCESNFPKFMLYSNITTVHKKGSILDLRNSRGVSRTNSIRSIFMRMLYNIKYKSIDANMSDGQMGGRKNKGCNNNLFIINGIIYDSLKSRKSKPVLLQIYDYAQMFNATQLEQALIDLFN